MRAALLVLALGLTACADLSLESRVQHADQLAAAAGWARLRIDTHAFVLSAYAPTLFVNSGLLTIYIEGDGFAWITPGIASDNPTPRRPLALELALKHAGAAAYLARPCQYVSGEDARGCSAEYWTKRRFAPEVIAATNEAIDDLKQRFGASRIALVGYSGGGAVAALVAARRTDIERLVTVAGNLDHRVWTVLHGVPELEGSLNAADEWQGLVAIPQLHLVGEKDTVVPYKVAASFAAHFPVGRSPTVRLVPGFDHACCWVAGWPALAQ